MRQRRVGGQHSQEGGHVRLNHTRAFDHAADAVARLVVVGGVAVCGYLLAALGGVAARRRLLIALGSAAIRGHQFPGGHLNRRLLRMSVGGHDSPGRCQAGIQRRAVGRAQLAQRRRDTSSERVLAQRHTDDAGGSNQHLIGPTAKLLSSDGAAAPGDIHARSAGRSIGIARVQHDCPDATASGALLSQMLSGKHHRSGAEDVLREYASRDNRTVGNHQCQVKALRTAAKTGGNTRAAQPFDSSQPTGNKSHISDHGARSPRD